MMTTRAEIVAEAREWIGTPWKHQQYMKGVGCDCIGMVKGVALALGLYPLDTASSALAQQFAGYGRVPRRGDLQRGLGLFATAIEREQADIGDVVLMRVRSEPQHVGLLGDYASGGFSLIHATRPAPGRVVEHRLDDEWGSLIVGYYRLPGVTA